MSVEVSKIFNKTNILFYTSSSLLLLRSSSSYPLPHPSSSVPPPPPSSPPPSPPASPPASSPPPPPPPYSWFSALLGKFICPMTPFTKMSSSLLKLAVILFHLNKRKYNTIQRPISKLPGHSSTIPEDHRTNVSSLLSTYLVLSLSRALLPLG